MSCGLFSNLFLRVCVEQIKISLDLSNSTRCHESAAVIKIGGPDKCPCLRFLLSSLWECNLSNFWSNRDKILETRRTEMQMLRFKATQFQLNFNFPATQFHPDFAFHLNRSHGQREIPSLLPPPFANLTVINEKKHDIIQETNDYVKDWIIA